MMTKIDSIAQIFLFLVVKLSVVLIFSALTFTAVAQEDNRDTLKNRPGAQVNLTRNGSANVRFITLIQAWVRTGDQNPGSVYREQPRTSLTDISLRRIVFTTVAQFSPDALVLLNVTGSGNSGDGSFQPALNVGILDAYGEYKFNNYFYLGGGLHQYTGLSRLNVDGVGSLLNLDQPLFQQPVWNKLDRIGRVMGIYMKGDIGGLNYRLSLNEPFAVPANSSAANTGHGSPNGGSLNNPAVNAEINVAYMNPAATSKMLQGYFEYAFWERESHVTPYETNTYHGEKRIFNLGTGFIFRNGGLFTPNTIALKDPVSPESISNPKVVTDGSISDLICYAFDGILMYPFSKRQDGVTVYAAWYHLGLGNNYYTVSPINAIAGAGMGVSPINGAGDAFPTTGTGHSFYTKLGYLAPNNWFGKSRLGVFGTYQYTRLQALADPVKVYEGGINWFINTNRVKLTTLYRNRPVYSGIAAFGKTPSTAFVDSRKYEIITQLQFNF